MLEDKAFYPASVILLLDCKRFVVITQTGIKSVRVFILYFQVHNHKLHRIRHHSLPKRNPPNIREPPLMLILKPNMLQIILHESINLYIKDQLFLIIAPREISDSLITSKANNNIVVTAKRLPLYCDNVVDQRLPEIGELKGPAVLASDRVSYLRVVDCLLVKSLFAVLGYTGQ